MMVFFFIGRLLSRPLMWTTTLLVERPSRKNQQGNSGAGALWL